MIFRLGNLSVAEIEKRLWIEFPEDTKEFMNKSHQPEANNILKGKWHCFDIPFEMVCGDMETAKIIVDSIKDKSTEFKSGFKVLSSESIE